MSFNPPSYVSATTGSHHGCSAFFCDTSHRMIASRTTPTLWVLVIATGPSSRPLSCTHVVPVISPLPFSVNHAAKTGSWFDLPRGWTIVTPVLTGPCPTTRLPMPATSVVCPTSTPATSVIASTGPGTPPIGRFKSRSRGFCAYPSDGSPSRNITRTNARAATLLSQPKHAQRQPGNRGDVLPAVRLVRDRAAHDLCAEAGLPQQRSRAGVERLEVAF